MAKVSKRITIKNAIIDSVDPLHIEEVLKDGSNFYDLRKIALEFANQEGVSITFAIDEDLPSNETDSASDK